MTGHLIIFAKVPEPGRVKTRLCGHITCEDAVELYDAFVADTVGMAASAGAFHVTLAYTPKSAEGYFTDRFDGLGVEFIPQEGADLGMRMHHALARAFGHGADRAALIGTDIPTLTAGEIKEAFARLDGSDVVLGPANDGGYFLVALKGPQPGIFEGVAWSTPHVLDTTLERAGAMGLSVSLIPGHTDVDTVMDLAALIDMPLPKNTRAVVERLRPKLAAL